MPKIFLWLTLGLDWMSVAHQMTSAFHSSALSNWRKFSFHDKKLKCHFPRVVSTNWLKCPSVHGFKFNLKRTKFCTQFCFLAITIFDYISKQMTIKNFFLSVCPIWLPIFLYFPWVNQNWVQESILAWLLTHFRLVFWLRRDRIWTHNF